MIYRLFDCSLAMILVATMFVSSASSQLVTEELSITVGQVIGGSDDLQASLLGMTGSGSFTYDASLLSGFGFESINEGQGLTIELDMFGQSFTEASDIDAGIGDFPVASFEDAEPLFLSIRVSESLFVSNPTAIALPGVEYFEFDSPLMPNQDGSFDISLLVLAAVPEPSCLGHLLWIGAATVMACRRR